MPHTAQKREHKQICFYFKQASAHTFISKRPSDRHAPSKLEAPCALEDSMIHNSAIHTTYRSWLRSSSIHEPRDPPLEVVLFSLHTSHTYWNILAYSIIERTKIFLYYNNNNNTESNNKTKMCCHNKQLARRIKEVFIYTVYIWYKQIGLNHFNLKTQDLTHNLYKTTHRTTQ